MTDEKKLLKRLASKINVPDLIALGEDQRLPVEQLHGLCHDERQPSSAFRAAWVLEYIAMNHPDRFSPVLDAFIDRFPQQRNPSCQRHFTKILMAVTDPKAPAGYRQSLSTANREALVEAVFGWLIHTDTPVAVKSNCLDILCHMNREFEWIEEELTSQIEFLMRDGSAAIQSRGRKVLDRLARQKRRFIPMEIKA